MKQLFWAVSALLIFTACGEVNQTDSRTTTLSSNYIGVNGETLIHEDIGNCPVDETDLPGQGYRAAGSTGGLAVVATPYPNMPDPSTYGLAWQVSETFLSTPGFNALGQENIAILVVDNFSGVYQLGSDVFGLTELDNNIYLDLVQNEQISHGATVFTHLAESLLGAGAIVNGIDSSQGIAEFDWNGQSILLQAVDTQGENTDFIATELANAIDDKVSEGFERVAVNMSFVMIPCSVKVDYNAFDNNEIASTPFEDYIEAVADVNGTSYEEMRDILTTPLPNDLLHELVQVPASSFGLSHLAYVASSGNYAFEFDMAPARWSEVVGVSSSDFEDNAPSSQASNFSNAGEVMITGAWFHLTDYAGYNEHGGDAMQVLYAGTSYGAPTLTAYMALNLSRTTPACDTAALAYGSPGGVSLTQAITDHCLP